MSRKAGSPSAANRIDPRWSAVATRDLFEAGSEAGRRQIGPAAWLLRGLAKGAAPALLIEVATIAAAAPFRVMHTPGGRPMSVAMTNCGGFGWVSDRNGYRYSPVDPQSGMPWPRMPDAFATLAAEAAAEAGYGGFDPDACLINRYEPGARMSLHQDRDERDLAQPIVSVSLGLPAVFLFGGTTRAGSPARVPLDHGDVAVWGGPDRLRYHGVMPVAPGCHPLTGACRINLTFRVAA